MSRRRLAPPYDPGADRKDSTPYDNRRETALAKIHAQILFDRNLDDSIGVDSAKGMSSEIGMFPAPHNGAADERNVSRRMLSSIIADQASVLTRLSSTSACGLMFAVLGMWS